MLTLSFTNNGRLATCDLKAGEIVIGRSPACSLVLSDVSVSRRHASVRVAKDRAFVRDLGSSFGTIVNGERLKKDEEVELQSGDSVKLGTVDMTVVEATAEISFFESDTGPSRAPAAIVRPVDVVVAGEPGVGAGRLLTLLSELSKTLVAVPVLADVLERVVQLTFDAIPAERAFLVLSGKDGDLQPAVMRYRDGRPLEQARLSRTVMNSVIRDRVAILSIDALDDTRVQNAQSILVQAIRSFMCAPLWNRNNVIGVLYVDSSVTSEFSREDLEVFTALANYAAVAIDQASLSERLLAETRRRERLQRYHSPGVVDRILNAPATETTMVAHEIDLSVMFCDIVGFTSRSETTPPQELALLLNEFFRRMTDVIFAHDGTVDKFIGDAILAVFGAPFPLANHAKAAVRAALGMRQALAEYNSVIDRPLEVRMAINSGMALAGDIGSPKRMEFTVLGDVVNTTSRIESSIAQRGQIVISRSTNDRVKDDVNTRSIGAHVLRGRTEPIELFVVEGERPH